MTEEEKIAKAKKDYTIGVDFIRGHIFTCYGDHKVESDGCISVCVDKDGNLNYRRSVYYKGQWAEIISKPDIYSKEQYMQDLEDKFIPDIVQPIEMEKDKRYLDIKKEIAGNLPGNDFFNKESHVEKLAQRKYFEMLLSEKDEYIRVYKNVAVSNKEAGLNFKRYSEELESINLEFTTIIDKRDKEIELLNNAYKSSQEQQDLYFKRWCKAEEEIETLKFEHCIEKTIRVDAQKEIEQLKQDVKFMWITDDDIIAEVKKYHFIDPKTPGYWLRKGLELMRDMCWYKAGKLYQSKKINKNE